MVVAVVVDAPNGSLSVLAVHEGDECEAARRLLALVLGEEGAADATERLEQLLQVVLGGLLWQIAHTHGEVVVLGQRSLAHAHVELGLGRGLVRSVAHRWRLVGRRVRRARLTICEC